MSRPEESVCEWEEFEEICPRQMCADFCLSQCHALGQLRHNLTHAELAQAPGRTDPVRVIEGAVHIHPLRTHAPQRELVAQRVAEVPEQASNAARRGHLEHRLIEQQPYTTRAPTRRVRQSYAGSRRNSTKKRTIPTGSTSCGTCGSTIPCRSADNRCSSRTGSRMR